MDRQLSVIGRLVLGVGLCATDGTASGAVIDLTNNPFPDLLVVDSDFGDYGWVADADAQPAGTGFFNPFLSLQLSDYEEWRALVNPAALPDGGSTAIFLGIALFGVGVLARAWKRPGA